MVAFQLWSVLCVTCISFVGCACFVFDSFSARPNITSDDRMKLFKMDLPCITGEMFSDDIIYKCMYICVSGALVAHEGSHSNVMPMHIKCGRLHSA